VKRQLGNRGIGYEALDNGIVSCNEPKRVQALCPRCTPTISTLASSSTQGRALRTETTINNTRDFGIGKLLKNLPQLRQVGFPATGVYRTSKLYRTIAGQRASALRFGDARVQATF
jgi:hypothetical protein